MRRSREKPGRAAYLQGRGFVVGRPTVAAGRRNGFTLIELLVTVSIIGLLSSIASVSYTTVRANARDTKRVSDVKQIQSAIEFYFEQHSQYPPDGQSGMDGIILGLPGISTFISDGGIGPEPRGMLFMQTVPRNPQPGGSEYIYRSLNRDGTDCNDRSGCYGYALLFSLERNQGSYLAGPHAVTSEGIAGPEGGYAGEGIVGAGGTIIGLESTQEMLALVAESTVQAVGELANDDRVETIAEVAVAPTAATVAIANTTLAAHSTLSAASYLFLLITQPLALLGRKRRKQWGTVYNSLSNLPVDLTIVRLRDADTGRMVRSEVTDKSGRFSFLVKRGRYRLEAIKGGFTFPSEFVAAPEGGAERLSVYRGETIEIAEDATLLAPNIPLDPVQREESDAAVIRRDSRRRLRSQLALLSPVLGGLAVVIRPSGFVLGLFAVQLLVYMIFRRLASVETGKNWGTIFDTDSRRPIPQAVLRIFALPYHKLLETQVADQRGRYHFRVGSNVYYVTVTKPGYLKTESEPFDLTEVSEPTVITSDLPLKRSSGQAAADQGRDGKPSLLVPPQTGPTDPTAGRADDAPPSGDTVAPEPPV